MEDFPSKSTGEEGGSVDFTFLQDPGDYQGENEMIGYGNLPGPFAPEAEARSNPHFIS